MLGLNKVQLLGSDYSRLIKLVEAKGMDTSALSTLQESSNFSQCTNEREVEVQILEPLLLRLGYEAKDWERQKRLKVGREHHAVPDYLIFPLHKGDFPSAQWVWEAKLSIPSKKHIQQATAQAVSYSRLVDAKGIGLVSNEGIWICRLQHRIEPAPEPDFFSLESLQDEKVFNALAKVINPKALGASKRGH